MNLCLKYLNLESKGLQCAIENSVVSPAHWPHGAGLSIIVLKTTRVRNILVTFADTFATQVLEDNFLSAGPTCAVLCPEEA